MFQSRITTTLASLVLTVAMAGSALAQSCDCSQASLMGTQVGTLLNSDYHGPVTSTVTGGIELANAGPTLHAAGNAPRWNINFGANTIRIDFLQQPATYGATSKFTFSNLNPTLPAPCPGTPYIVGMTVTTNKPGAVPYVVTAASFGPHTVVAPFAPATSAVDWYPGEYILITLRFACDVIATPPPVTFDPCCPPWNAATLKSSLVYQGTGGISDPYTLKFTPSPAVNSALFAYLNYLNVLFGSTSLGITFTGAPTGGTATWTQPNIGPSIPSTIFNPGSMTVGTWYTICTKVTANGHVPPGFISDKCNSCISVRIQVLGARGRVLQTKLPSGQLIEQSINANGRAQ